MEIKIKIFPGGRLPEKSDKGDWIDVFTREEVRLYAGGSAIIGLGFSCELPDGYEAHIVPRSSLFKTYGVLQTNGLGVIDQAYAGDADEWRFPVYATVHVSIPAGAKVAQFRLVKKQPKVPFTQVDHLDKPSRGGFGSTGDGLEKGA